MRTAINTVGRAPLSGRVIAVRNRRLLCCLAGLAFVTVCLLCGYWTRLIGSRFDVAVTAGCPLGGQVRHGQGPPPPLKNASYVREYRWQYEALLKQIDSHMYRFDWKTLMPLMRLEANETGRAYRVKAGLAWMRTQGLVVAATVRSAMSGMPDSLRNVDRLRALFNRSWIVFVESDSNDGTRDYLHDLSKKDPSVRLLGCSPVNSREPCRPVVTYRSGRRHEPGWVIKRTRDEQIDRGQVMSALRNQYLEYAYDHLVPLGATLLMTIDADVSWHQWDLDNIAQGVYYFKTKPLLQQLCSHTCIFNRATIMDPCSLTFFNNKHFGEDRTKPQLSYEKDLHHAPPDLPPVKVASCFQALAFHRLEDMASARVMYGGVPDEWNCEHNTLSRKLSEVYFDPQMKLDITNVFSG